MNSINTENTIPSFKTGPSLPFWVVGSIKGLTVDEGDFVLAQFYEYLCCFLITRGFTLAGGV